MNVAVDSKAMIAGRTSLFRNQVAVVDPACVPERGVAAAAAGVAAAGPGSGGIQCPRTGAAVGLPHQILGEWCCGAKCVKSVKAMAG